MLRQADKDATCRLEKLAASEGETVRAACKSRDAHAVSPLTRSAVLNTCQLSCSMLSAILLNGAARSHAPVN